MRVAVVTDSNSGISIKSGKELGVFVVPMPFLIDGEEYFEDVNLTQELFYEKLKNNATVSTSQPSTYVVSELWKEILEDYDELVYIPMSSGLSASCNTAVALSSEFGGKVQVVDNKRISVPQKQSVLDAVKMANEGKSAKEIKAWLEKTGKDSSIYIMVGTLKYLKKGGRITPAAAMFGSMLKIKPVLTIQGDKLDKFAQVISFNLGKKRMMDQIEKELNSRFADYYKDGKVVVDMAYTENDSKAIEFKKEVDKMLEKYNLSVSRVEPLSLSISCHIGEGALGIAITRKR